MDALGLVGLSVGAFAASTICMLLLRPLAYTLGLIDRPGGHKTHRGEVPVIGGIAMYAGLVAASLFGHATAEHWMSILVIALLMVIVGALDDRLNLAPRTRLIVQLIAAVALVGATGHVVSDLGDLLGYGPIPLSSFAPVFTVIACIALINAFNMLDGMDGLAGSAGLVTCVALATIAWASGSSSMAALAVCAAASTLGFLLFNLPFVTSQRFRAFMGDSGSTLLGLVVAGLALVLVQPDDANVPPVVILWTVALPIFELFDSTFRRLRRHVSPVHADNGHFHHRLLGAGFSVRAIFAIYLAFSVVMSFLGFLGFRLGISDHLMFLGFIASFLTWQIFVHSACHVVLRLPHYFQRHLHLRGL